MNGDWVLLPMRAFEDGKQRLADTLCTQERAKLNEQLFRHVLDTACAVFGPSRSAIVTRAQAIRQVALAAGAVVIDETDAGLNQAVQQGADALFAAGAQRVSVLHCDLPFARVDDLAALLTPPEDIVLAPDHAGTGTNAVRMGRNRRIAFRFGEGSFAAHQAEARRGGLSVAMVRRTGLACDIDLPSDLALLSA